MGSRDQIRQRWEASLSAETRLWRAYHTARDANEFSLASKCADRAMQVRAARRHNSES